MHLSNIIYLLVVAVLIAALWILLYHRQRDMGRMPSLLLKNDFKGIIGRALHDLNIKVEWAKENDNNIVHYTYQGGHFNILLEKNSPYARITFLFFFQTDVDNINVARVVCNLCNLNTDACRIVYTVDEKKGKVDMHLISVLPVSSKGMRDILERVMGDAFRWQNTFTTKFEEQQKDVEKVGIDKEVGKAQMERDIQLVHEQEMTHQEGGPHWHESSQKLMTLQSVLSTAMGLSEVIPIKLILTIDDEPFIIDDPDAILGYDVSKTLISNDEFKHASASGRLDFYDPGDPVTPRSLLLGITRGEATRETLYYRMTMALVPVSVSITVNEDSEQHSKLMTSVLLGYDLVSTDEKQAHFRYVWKEAMGKLKASEEKSMTDEEKVIAHIQDHHIAANFYRGRSLYLHRRYYEALLPLTNVFRSITSIYDHHDRHVVELIDETAYFIGCCYMSLHQYDRASYYLQLTLPTTHQSYTEAYINCLVNGGDYRAMDVINGLLSSLQVMLDRYDDDDEDDRSEEPNREQIERFIGFVKRRKAYMLVNLGKYDEAERLLKQLLDDPDNSDFALKELAYIQKSHQSE